MKTLSLSLLLVASISCFAVEDSEKFGVNEVDASIAKYEKAEKAAMDAYKAAKVAALQKLIIELKPMVDPLAKKDIQKAAALQTKIDDIKNTITLLIPSNKTPSIVGKWKANSIHVKYTSVWTFTDDGKVVSSVDKAEGKWTVEKNLVRCSWNSGGWDVVVMEDGKTELFGNNRSGNKVFTLTKVP